MAEEMSDKMSEIMTILNPCPPDVGNFIPVLLCKLGKELGLKRMNVMQNLKNTKLNCRNIIRPCDFRKRFLQQQDATEMDGDERVLQELRYKMLLHLYRLLVKLEPNETNRDMYMSFIYELIPVEKKLKLEESLEHRKEHSDRLIKLADSINQLISTIWDKARATIVKMGFAHTIHFACRLRLIRTNKRIECEIIQILYVSKPQDEKILDTSAILLNDKNDVKESGILTVFPDVQQSEEKQVPVNSARLSNEKNDVIESKILTMFPDTNNFKLDKTGLDKSTEIQNSENTAIKKLTKHTFHTYSTKDGQITNSTPIYNTEESMNLKYARDQLLQTYMSGTDFNVSPCDSEKLPTSSSEMEFVETSGATELIGDSISKSSDIEVKELDLIAHRATSKIIESRELQQDKSSETGLDYLIRNIDKAFESPNEIVPVLEQKVMPSKITLKAHPRELASKVELEIVKMEPMVDTVLTQKKPATAKWQHQRHIIAASRFIIRLFKCNPAYQCSTNDRNAPNFNEQLLQFFEVMANSSPNSTIDAAAVEKRISLIVDRIIKEPLSHADMAKIQLKQVLTTAEHMEYEKLLWKLQDYRNFLSFPQENQLQDALHSLLGYECQQLRYSALNKSLMLRWPSYQSNISESYLLLSLGQVGFYYKELHLQLSRLQQLGGIGKELSSFLLVELQLYSKFHYQQKAKHNQNLMRVFWQTRRFFYRFCWLLQLCHGFKCRQPLLKYLQLQLNVGNKEYNDLLERWLQAATQTLLTRISSWLVNGKLSDKEGFFIVNNMVTSPNHYWHLHFELDKEQLPPFLDRQLAQKVLNIGKCQDYAKQFLGLQLNEGVAIETLQLDLSNACTQHHKQLEPQPLEQLISRLELQTAHELFHQVKALLPAPLDLITKMHQYLLLTNVEFVGELIELLEPALEQPVDHYDTYLLNNMLEPLLVDGNKQLYVTACSSSHPQNTFCWQRFLLSWQHTTPWLPLLGHSLEQYESCSKSIWHMHYVDYVLHERIRRQHMHFHERIDLEASQEARNVKARFKPFIEQLLKFMHNVRSYVLNDVLEYALRDLTLDCLKAGTLDELLEKHGSYLNSIELGLLLHHKSRLYMDKLFDIIMLLDTIQQKFFALCQLFNQSSTNLEGRQEFRWSCLNTSDSISDMEKQFQWNKANLLLSLFCTRDQQLLKLAKRLDHNGYYTQMANFQSMANPKRKLKSS